MRDVLRHERDKSEKKRARFMIRRIREKGIREKETGAKGMKKVNGRRKKKERRRG